MPLEDLVSPLERLTDEVLMFKELKDLHYLFQEFFIHFTYYVDFGDDKSYSLLGIDEIAFITRLPEDSYFLSNCLLVILDIMEAVRIDYLGDDAEPEEKEKIHRLISDAIENINRITFHNENFNEDDPDFDQFDN